MARGLDVSVCFGSPGPGQELGDPAVGPVVDELGENVGEVGLGIDAVQLAGLDQRGEHRPVFRPLVAAGEEGIFSGEGNRAHSALDGVGVDLDAAVIEEAGEPSQCLSA